MTAMLRAISLAIGLGAAPLAADDLALIITNERYDTYPAAGPSQPLLDLFAPLTQAGFTTQIVETSRVGISFDEADGLWTALTQSDRLIVILGGHFVHSAFDTWLLHSDAGQVSVFSAGQEGLPLSAFYQIAADRPGDAMIVLADSGAPLPQGSGLAGGAAMGDVPQGVTVLAGQSTPVAAFLRDEILQSGNPLALAATRAPQGVTVEGFLPRSRGFIEGAGPAPTNPGFAQQLEDSLWRQAESANSVDSYQTYLQRYPNGRFASTAEQRIKDLTLTPQDRARIAEEALGLSREQRRMIQRQLTLLGFDTRGVDGLLGRNSRKAIGRWQTSIGVPDTGYLTANQITHLQSAAEIRAAELKAEAERRRAEAERKDRLYWSQTGQGGSEAGLRAYLQRYPDGLFSGQARSKLDAIEREKRRLAAAEERAAWDEAVLAGTVDSYKRYLALYPRGRFVEEAKARIASLQQPETPPEVVEAAKKEEANLSLNGFSRRLAEAQLKALSFDPGAVDGNFTRDTRRAIRQFQRASGMTVTGYITRETVIRLLAAPI